MKSLLAGRREPRHVLVVARRLHDLPMPAHERRPHVGVVLPTVRNSQLTLDISTPAMTREEGRHFRVR